MKKLTLLIAVFFASIAHAEGGNGVGNGGDVVACPTGQPFAIQLLDYYEAGVFVPDFSLDLGDANLSVEEKGALYLKKLAKVSPVRAKNYEDIFHNFFSKVFWLRNSKLTDIPDSNHLVLPRGCEIDQIAIQLSDELQIPGKRYIIDEDLWDRLDNNNKIGLVFHEIIYQETLQFGHTNSVAARKLNAWISSVAFSSVTTEEFSKYVLGIGLRSYEMVPGYPELYLDGIHYEDDGSFHGGTSHLSYIPLFGQRMALKAGTYIRFYKDNKIAGLCCGDIFPESSTFTIGENTFSGHLTLPDTMNFYPNGVPEFFWMDSGDQVDVKTKYGPIKIWPWTVGYYPDGNLKYLNLVAPTSFEEEGRTYICKGSIMLWDTGQLNPYESDCQ